jgi:RHS repeat-associated protein
MTAFVSLLLHHFVRHYPDGLSYLLGDHLGSTNVTANVAGTWSGELLYGPWGATRYSYGVTPTSYRYTGQREEASIGLYYYGARWYDPLVGRFIQPDTLVPDPANPQSLNRYAYTLNNPLKYTDPTGHCVTPMGVPVPGCFEFLMRVGQQVESLVVQYGPSVIQLLQQWSDKLPALVDKVDPAGNQATGNVINGGNTASSGGSPNDPFKGLPEQVQRGVQRLRQGTHNPIQQFALGYRAQLTRAEYWVSSDN